MDMFKGNEREDRRWLSCERREVGRVLFGKSVVETYEISLKGLPEAPRMFVEGGVGVRGSF